MAHGVHPNFMDMHEEYHRPEMQKGLVIKHNANQRYATSGVTSFLFQEIGKIRKIHNLPTQVTSTYRWSSLSVERGKMIKRQFYKMEHDDRDDASNQFSSSSSESEIQVQSEAEEVSSGYKTEDSSANETLVYTSASGFPIDDGNERDSPKHDLVFGNSGSEFQEQSSNTYADKESPSVDLPEYVVKRKSTFKRRICPRIVCLNEEALSAHLKSKRHARSEKLLNEGRLKTVLNIDGKLDEEDTHALYARILASPQALPRKRSKQEDKRRPRKKRMR